MSISIGLERGTEVTLEVAPGTEPGKLVDLVPAGRNEFPFQVLLLSIFDKNAALEDEDDENGADAP